MTWVLEEEVRNIGQTIETIEVNNDYDEQITILVTVQSLLTMRSVILSQEICYVFVQMVKILRI